MFIDLLTGLEGQKRTGQEEEEAELRPFPRPSLTHSARDLLFAISHKFIVASHTVAFLARFRNRRLLLFSVVFTGNWKVDGILIGERVAADDAIDMKGASGRGVDDDGAHCRPIH